jgi:hypothetical protein
VDLVYNLAQDPPFYPEHLQRNLSGGPQKQSRWSPAVLLESETATLRILHGATADEDMDPCHISRVTFFMWSPSDDQSIQSMASLIFDNDWDAIIKTLKRFSSTVPVVFRFLYRQHCGTFLRSLPDETQNAMTMDPNFQFQVRHDSPSQNHPLFYMYVPSNPPHHHSFLVSAYPAARR